jgi:hypothetical protein
MDLRGSVAKAQLQLLGIQLTIKAEGWDKDPDWVNRGENGRFGGGTVKVTKEAKDVIDSTVKTVGITKDVIKLSLTDPGFRERVGLSAGMGIAEIIKATSKAIEKTPELEKKIDGFVQQSADKLAKDYGGDKDPLAQAIRKSDGLEPLANSSFAEKMEFAVAKYQLYTEALANPEKYTPPQQQELVGKSIRASIPLVTNIAINVGIGVTIGLLLKESLNHAIASAVLGEAVYKGAEKGLDKAKVDNPVLKVGVLLVAGIASDQVIRLAAKKIAELGAKKIVAEGLKKEAKTLTKSLVENFKQVKQKKILKSALGDIEINSTISTFKVGKNKVAFTVNSSTEEAEEGIEFLMKTIDFKVNDSFDKKPLKPEESKAIMYKLRALLKEDVKKSPDGTIFDCHPHAEDGYKEKRVTFYKLMGFAETENDSMRAIVKNGKLVPHP